MAEFSRDAKEVSPSFLWLVLFSNITTKGLKGQAQLLSGWYGKRGPT